MSKRGEILLCFFLLTLLFSMKAEGRCIKVSPSQPLKEQFRIEHATYNINTTIDLKGKTLVIPDGSVLHFGRKGRLENGSLSGHFRLRKVRKGSLNVNYSNCRITGKVPVFNNGDVAGLMTSCTEECILREDVEIKKSVVLKASINGNGHTLRCLEMTAVAIYIVDSKNPITIKALTLVKKIPVGTINKNYALNIRNSSNVTVEASAIYGRIHCTNTTMSDAESDVSRHISFINCHLEADFSDCQQGWEYGQDHIAFFSIKDVRIEGCKLFSRNVNRVIKSSAYFPEKNYEHPQNCSNGIVFRNNKVKAEANYGKQFWDMFCGTVNVLVENNDISLKGFSRFIEDKAYQPKYSGNELLSSNIEIRNNIVVMDNGNLFQFKAHKDVDNFVVSGNHFTLIGANTNPFSKSERSCCMQLQGYQSCKLQGNSFILKDEAVGLPFANMNFDSGQTVIAGNEIQDAYRIYFSSATSPVTGDKVDANCNQFIYTGNKKTYTSAYGEKSRVEIYVVKSRVESMEIDVTEMPVTEENVVEFGSGAKINNLSVTDDTKMRTSYIRVNTAKDADVKIKRLPTGVIRQGTDWRRP